MARLRSVERRVPSQALELLTCGHWIGTEGLAETGARMCWLCFPLDKQYAKRPRNHGAFQHQKNAHLSALYASSPSNVLKVTANQLAALFADCGATVAHDAIEVHRRQYVLPVRTTPWDVMVHSITDATSKFCQHCERIARG